MQILLRFELATRFGINKDHNTTTSHCELKNESNQFIRRSDSSVLKEKSLLSIRDEMRLEEERCLPHHELKVIKKFLECISILLDFDFDSHNSQNYPHNPNYKGFVSFFDDILFRLYPFSHTFPFDFCVLFPKKNILFL